MACGKLTSPANPHVNTASASTWTYAPTTEWFLCTGIDAANAVLKMQDSTTLVAHAAYQTAATRTDDPNAWATFPGSDLTANGAACTGISDISAATEANFYIRFGVAYKAAPSQTFGEGGLFLQASFDQCGRLIGSHTFEVNIGTANTYDEPVTPWIPATNVEAVKFAVLMTGVDHLQCQPIQQTATTSVQSPGAWATVAGSSVITPVGTDTSISACSGELMPTGLSTVMWVRFGLRYSITTGSLGVATLSAAVATRN